MIRRSRKRFDAGTEAYNVGAYQDAVATFQSLVECADIKNDELEYVYLWLADCHHHLKQFEIAVECCETAIDIGGRSDDAVEWWSHCMNSLGTKQFKQERFSDALATFTRLLERGDLEGRRLERSLLWVGICYQLLGDYGKAILALEKTLKLFPDSMLTRVYLAYVLATAPEAQLRDGERAEALARQMCVESSWTDWGKLTLLAAAEAELGNFRAAVATYERAIELMPLDEREKREGNLESLRRGKPIRCSPKLDKMRLVKPVDPSNH